VAIFASEYQPTYHTSSIQQPSEIPGFTFVNSRELQSIISRDYQELVVCSQQKLHKATVVMAGAVLEALLLDALLQQKQTAEENSKAPKSRGGDVKSLEEWGLNDLLTVALELKLIENNIEGLSHPIRELRNLIHAGKEIRTKTIFDENEAGIAIRVVNIVIRNLSSCTRVES